MRQEQRVGAPGVLGCSYMVPIYTVIAEAARVWADAVSNLGWALRRGASPCLLLLAAAHAACLLPAVGSGRRQGEFTTERGNEVAFGQLA